MPQSELRFTLAQLNPTVGDLSGNAKHMLDVWKEHDHASDLVIFPELFLCGYPPEDLVLNAAFISACKDHIDDICAQSKSYVSAALIPTIWEENNKIYNAALIIDNGEIRNIIHKHKLPNNYVFDELRTFQSGELQKPIEFKGHQLGIMICEDVWHIEVPQHLKDQGADLLIAINGSPFHNYQSNERHAVASECVQETGLDLVYLNMIGGQDELVFDGRSFIMNREGEYIYHAPAFEGHICNFTIHNNPETTHTEFNFSTESSQQEEQDLQNLTYKALTLGIRDYVKKNGFSDVLIGLSGGIDSALTAALAVDALGADHVHCIMMPSKFTSNDSLEDAKACAEFLNVAYEIIPIKNAVSVFEKTVSQLSGLAHENTQSRIRGTILMALSNASGAMVLTTGNKSEMAVGYCTIYGDMNGGFNALKDVYKTDVYKLATWRNEQSPVMPERIITKAPSAELRDNQTDQDSLPDYDLLDKMLKLLIEYDNVHWNYAPKILLDIRDECMQHPEQFDKVARLLKNSEYKRFQSAPGTRISFRAFGRDRRYPMTNHFVNNIEKKQ